MKEEVKFNDSIPNCIEYKGVRFCVQKWSTHKNPVLFVEFAGEACQYKVASFNSIATANWFLEVVHELLLGDKQNE